MSDVNVTVIGHVGTEPVLATSGRGTDWCTFRLASTRRVRDPQTGEWSDGETLWFTVKLFRERARHVSMSLRKGDPVVVVGRLTYDEWEAEHQHVLPDGSVTTLPERRNQPVVEAQQVGVDATRGVVRYARLASGRDRGAADPWDQPPAAADDASRATADDRPDDAAGVRADDREDGRPDDAAEPTVDEHADEGAEAAGGPRVPVPAGR
ncbi:single-stranded DNA-binding protein [Isoptericola sp. BMS4]|uniref:single-stranded DNA-binding protein n=1 Tax=Isoptericola sp. BMS4 TaxID=2527875 RepID=UPI001F0D8ED3|nr:single-stranded DNA-binding protein [Isoptericola sp. BMS4]